MLMHFGSGYEGKKGVREIAQGVRLEAAPECNHLAVAEHPRHGRGALTRTN